MELVHPLEPTGEESPLARARLHRQLTVEETARRAGHHAPRKCAGSRRAASIASRSRDDALIATALYATALGLGQPRGARAGRAARSAAADRSASPLPRRARRRRRRDRSCRVRGAAPDPTLGRQADAGRSERHSAAAVANPGQRPERQRRHQLHAAGRKPHRRVRLQHQEGRAAPTTSTTRRPRSSSSRSARASPSGSRSNSALRRNRSRAARDPCQLVVIVGPATRPRR